MTKQQIESIKLFINDYFDNMTEQQLKDYYNGVSDNGLDALNEAFMELNIEDDDYTITDLYNVEQYIQQTLIKCLLHKLGNKIIDNARTLIGEDTIWEEYGRELLQYLSSLENN